jgi:hypothetical protein
VLPAGMAFVAGGLVLYAQLPVHGHYFWNLLPALLLSGLGLAFAFVPVSIGALTGVSGDEAGVACGGHGGARLQPRAPRAWLRPA